MAMSTVRMAMQRSLPKSSINVFMRISAGIKTKNIIRAEMHNQNDEDDDIN